MASGLAATTLANKWLNMLAGTAYTAPTTTYVQLHTGEPGAAGSTAVSSVTTRPAVIWAAASAGSIAITTAYPSWTAWAGVNGEIVTNVSLWDAATSGNFLFSILLTSSKTINTGDSLTLSSMSMGFSPIAA